jgi:hypothetical protein
MAGYHSSREIGLIIEISWMLLSTLWIRVLLISRYGTTIPIILDYTEITGMVCFDANIPGEDFSIYSRRGSSQPNLIDLRRSSTSLDDLGPFNISQEDFLVEGSRSCDSHKGGRVLDAIIRAYAAKTAGEPRIMKVRVALLMPLV